MSAISVAGPGRKDGGIAGYVVGAYAASPTATTWDPQLEAEYLATLAADPRIAAFEVPWTGSLHSRDEEWFLAHYPARLGAVLTDVALAFLATAKDPDYGLAAQDDEGRARGLADAARMRDDVRRFNDSLGHAAVRAVELHSPPRAARGGASALAQSLAEVASWDWDGADLVVEHCDALVPGHDPEKGFLALAAETGAIRESGAPVGIAVNWGRSAIELRDPGRVPEHITAAREAGLLRGCIFSGASGQNGYFDRPWVDAHNLFRRSPEHPHGDPDSLLTDEHVSAAVRAAGDDVWLGVKLGWPAQRPGRLAERVNMISDALSSLDRAAAAAALARPDPGWPPVSGSRLAGQEAAMRAEEGKQR